MKTNVQIRKLIRETLINHNLQENHIEHQESLNEGVFYPVKNANIYRGDFLKFTDEDYKKLPKEIQEKVKPNKKYCLIGTGGYKADKDYCIIEDESVGEPIVLPDKDDQALKLMTALTIDGSYIE